MGCGGVLQRTSGNAQRPFPCSCVGLWLQGPLAPANADFKIHLCPGLPTSLEQLSFLPIKGGIRSLSNLNR